MEKDNSSNDKKSECPLFASKKTENQLIKCMNGWIRNCFLIVLSSL